MEECSSCMDALEATRITGDPVCWECLEKTFQAAIDEETAYPPSWGPGQKLNIDDFTNVLTPDFVRKYKDREQLYSVPPNYRLFCAPRVGRPDCGILLGDRRTFGAARPQPIQCEACQHSTCACGAPYLHEGHACEADLGPGFHPTERAITWQQCPNPGCLMKALKNGGCNHMLCACGTDYCFLCGQAAPGPDILAHWRNGGCLAYGRPGGEGAGYFEDEEEGPHFPFGIDDPLLRNELDNLDTMQALIDMNTDSLDRIEQELARLGNQQRLLRWRRQRGEIDQGHYTTEANRTRSGIIEQRRQRTALEAENREHEAEAQEIFSFVRDSGRLNVLQLREIQVQFEQDSQGVWLVG